jgi:hypothetical protein
MIYVVLGTKDKRTGIKGRLKALVKDERALKSWIESLQKEEGIEVSTDFEDDDMGKVVILPDDFDY